MQLDTNEFIRRYMLHVLPSGFHRIRHYGLLSSQTKLSLARRLLDVSTPEFAATSESIANKETALFQCRKCHQPMIIMAITMPIYLPRAPPWCEQS
jgi:hypothetical protein